MKTTLMLFENRFCVWQGGVDLLKLQSDNILRANIKTTDRTVPYLGCTDVFKNLHRGLPAQPIVEYALLVISATLGEGAHDVLAERKSFIRNEHMRYG